MRSAIDHLSHNPVSQVGLPKRQEICTAKHTPSRLHNRGRRCRTHCSSRILHLDNVLHPCRRRLNDPSAWILPIFVRDYLLCQTYSIIRPLESSLRAVDIKERIGMSISRLQRRCTNRRKAKDTTRQRRLQTENTHISPEYRLSLACDDIAAQHAKDHTDDQPCATGNSVHRRGCSPPAEITQALVLV